jgi:Ca2+-transporting ATPase
VLYIHLQIGSIFSSYLFACILPILQREKGRHRPPIESRLRDERGQRFDKNVDSSNHDGSSENPDDPMYDSYGDPAVNGDFPADAPPMLVPVPGAG